MEVHGALHTLDNVTDVSQSLDSLAEQASYIWFTREIDAQMQPGRVELPPKDPASVRSTLRHGDATERRGVKSRAGSGGGSHAGSYKYTGGIKCERGACCGWGHAVRGVLVPACGGAGAVHGGWQ